MNYERKAIKKHNIELKPSISNNTIDLRVKSTVVLYFGIAEPLVPEFSHTLCALGNDDSLQDNNKTNLLKQLMINHLK